MNKIRDYPSVEAWYKATFPDANDWDIPSPDHRVRAIEKQLSPQSILDLEDIFDEGFEEAYQLIQAEKDKVKKLLQILADHNISADI